MLCSTKIGTRCLLETGQRLAQVLIPGKPTPLHVRLKARSSVVQLARFLRLRRADRTDEIQNGNAIHHEAFFTLAGVAKNGQRRTRAANAFFGPGRQLQYEPGRIMVSVRAIAFEKALLGISKRICWRHGKGGKREDWRIEMQQGLKCLRENQCSDRMNW